MRSSKSRSRSKSSRPRSLGNVINRVFDSSGPDGKVRGTPQQIIDKYLVLARDAQLSNDRVASENFLQHAEHYTRLLSEAQQEMNREAEARREAQEAQARQQSEGRGRGGDDGRDDRGQPQGASQGASQGGRQPRGEAEAESPPREQRRPVSGDSAQVIDLEAEGAGDSNLVETPEAARLREEPDVSADSAEKPAEGSAEPGAEGQAGGEKPAPRRRSPRKPRGTPKAGAEPDASAGESRSTAVK
jgi:hypothetical protein